MDEIHAEKDGFVAEVDARIIGEAVHSLGGGRRVIDAAVDFDVGIDKLVVVGEAVGPGYLLGRVQARTCDGARRAVTSVREALRLSAEPTPFDVPFYEIVVG